MATTLSYMEKCLGQGKKPILVRSIWTGCVVVVPLISVFFTDTFTFHAVPMPVQGTDISSWTMLDHLKVFNVTFWYSRCTFLVRFADHFLSEWPTRCSAPVFLKMNPYQLPCFRSPPLCVDPGLSVHGVWRNVPP